MAVFEVSVHARTDRQAQTSAMGSIPGVAMSSIPGPAMGSIPVDTSGPVTGPAMSSIPTAPADEAASAELFPLGGR